MTEIDIVIEAIDEILADIEQHDSQCRIPYGDVDAANASLNKLSRHISNRIGRYKGNLICHWICDLGDEEIQVNSGVRVVKVDEGSRKSALSQISAISYSMTLPNVSIDNYGTVCFEWGSVYDKYLLLKFSELGYALFFQRDESSEVEFIDKQDALINKKRLELPCRL